jgi:hypothetical protein
LMKDVVSLFSGVNGTTTQSTAIPKQSGRHNDDE